MMSELLAGESISKRERANDQAASLIKAGCDITLCNCMSQPLREQCKQSIVLLADFMNNAKVSFKLASGKYFARSKEVFFS